VGTTPGAAGEGAANIAAHRLRERLAAHSIEVRPTRNSAVLALAQNLPAPVVSTLLGLNINTAVHWAKCGKNDWAAYLQTRRATERGLIGSITQPAQAKAATVEDPAGLVRGGRRAALLG
jgi:hypothetical protein